MKKHAFRIGLVVTMLLGLMMISANAACDHENPHPAGSSHDGTWTPLTAQTAAYTVETGKYFLDTTDTSVTFAGKITISGDVTICLNGKTLDSTFAGTSGGTNAIELASGATLTICDCSTDQSGKIITSHAASTSKLKRLIAATAGGATLNIWGGTLDYSNVTAGKTTNSTTIYATKDLTINMHGGEISGNSVGSGVVYFYYTGAYTGVVNMCGGTMDNEKPSVYFRLDSASSTGTLNMSGGTLGGGTEVFATRENTATKGTAYVNISGDATLNGGIRDYMTEMTITGGTFTNKTNLTAADGYYFYDNGNGTYTVYQNGYAPEPPADQEGEENHGTGNGFWIPLTTAADFSSIEAGKKYYLDGDVTLDLAARYVFPVGEVTLCLHGHSLKSSAGDNEFFIQIPADATVNLQDCDVNTTEGTISPADGNGSARGVLVSSGGTFNMSGGAITGFTNTGTSNGGGVQLNGGTMNMSGGSITNNHADSAKGGGVYLAKNSTLIISGGTISNNTANLGGGIYATSATVTISGGTISGNTATIVDDSAYEGGGGIYSYGATVELSGGKIFGNSALYGGAVRGNNGAEITVSGDVEIYDNEAACGGAAVCVYNKGSLTVNGGYIYGNFTKGEEANADVGNDRGAAIAITSGTAALTISDGASIGIKPDGTPAANYCNAAEKTTEGSIAFLYGGATGTVTGGQFYAEEGEPLFGGYSSTEGAAIIKVSGGSFSSDLEDKNLADGYFAYKLAENAETNFPFVVKAKFEPSKVSLLVQNKNGLGLKFYVKKADIPGLRSDYVVEFNGVRVTDGNVETATYDWIYRGIAAKDMGDTVKVEFKNNDKVVYTAEFSAKDYVEEFLNTSTNESKRKTASDLLRYGAAAQTYFGLAEGEKLVTEGMNDILVEGSNYTPANNADLTADTNELYKGSSLSLKNNIVLNLYFDSSVTGVTVGGVDMSSALEEYNGYKVVKFSDTNVLKLSTVGTALEIVITVGDADPITISDSVEAYAYRATQLAGEDKLTALCQAMMNFVTSAAAAVID